MSKQVLLAMLCVCSIVSILHAQQGPGKREDSLNEKTLEEVIISANKFAERRKYVSQKVEVITSRNIAAANAQNTGDLLIHGGNVFVQKSQQGGSSPVIRGFEASRVLLVIDGIRMNNAIYRAGHLQNVITVDQNMLERAEVLYGPGSTLYGSDALGGVIHLRTKSPVLSVTNKIKAVGVGFIRHSTANKEKTGHFNISLGGKKLGWIQAYTFSDFGDMRMGRNDPDDYPRFWTRDSFILYRDGIDVVAESADNRVQKHSGYRQWDIMQKIIFSQNEKINHLLNFQFSGSGNIPRYDRLQDKRYFNGSTGTTLRFAEWYYGPQTRYLASYELNMNALGILDRLRLNINYQNIRESRHQREYRRYDRFDSRKENLHVLGFVVDTYRKWGNNEITIGADGQINDVTSTASRTDLTTGAISKIDTRYPDGENRMNYFGAFAQHLMKIAGSKLILNDGLRFQYVSLRSNIVDNSFFNLPVTEIEQDHFALTGNLALIYLPSDDFRVNAGFSSGFRSPNIDDLSRVFESSSDQKRVVIPNPRVKPEYTYNFDLGITNLINNAIRFEITGFFTFYRNAIALAPFQLNGQDSIDYNGVTSAVYANRNLRKANTYGYNMILRVSFTHRLVFNGTVTKTYGRYRNEDGSTFPQDHIPPFYGKTGLVYVHERFSTEGYLLFNGWKRIKDYNLEGEDNLQYATPDGMPSWITVNWKASFNLSEQASIQFGIENILDRNYRYFASGFSSAGRNFIMAIRASF